MLPIAQFSAAKVWLWIIIIIKSGGWIDIYKPHKEPHKTGRKPMFSKCIHILQNNLKHAGLQPGINQCIYMLTRWWYQPIYYSQQSSDCNFHPKCRLKHDKQLVSWLVDFNLAKTSVFPVSRKSQILLRSNLKFNNILTLYETYYLRHRFALACVSEYSAFYQNMPSVLTFKVI